jgi:hypothetical protein
MTPIGGATILRDGALLSLLASIVLLTMLRLDARLFLSHYPREIRAVVPPKSVKERRVSVLIGLLIGIPLVWGMLWRTATVGGHSFRERFTYAFGVLFIFNLVDLVILDWLIVCWLKPRWASLPGTEHVESPNLYFHHFKEFLIGTVGLVMAGLVIAALLSIGS